MVLDPHPYFLFRVNGFMSKLSNIASHHFVQPMRLSVIIGIPSFLEKHLLITG
jgi:hypothetical protein